MRAGYHSYCGCCGQRNDERREWCDACEGHVADVKGPPWVKTYFAQHGTPCPNEDINGCGLRGEHGYCERPEGHDGAHSTTVWWDDEHLDPALRELLAHQEERLADSQPAGDGESVVFCRLGYAFGSDGVCIGSCQHRLADNPPTSSGGVQE